MFLFIWMPQTVKCGLDEETGVQMFTVLYEERFVEGHLCSLGSTAQ